jgi:L-fuconolactonase
MSSLDIVDTHTHVVSPDTATHPVAPGMTADNQWHIDHPISGDALLSLMDAALVQRVVMVQAMSCYGYDNRYVIE